jgi:predicted lipoprotein
MAIQDGIRRRRPAIPWLVAALASVVLLTGGCAKVPGIYVVEKPGSNAAAPGGAFNANSYAAGVWSTKVVPTVLARSTDATTLLAAIKADPDTAGKKYGVQSGVGSPYSMMIKGTGRILAVAESTGAGQLQVDLDPPDGRPDLSIAIGPVFLGTALRDAVGFISFSQFTNQVDYADAATALNSQVRQKVVATLDTAAATGRSVTFAGAFQLLDPNNIVVTPVQLGVS